MHNGLHRRLRRTLLPRLLAAASLLLTTTLSAAPQPLPCSTTTDASMPIVQAALKKDEAEVLRSIADGADLTLCVSEREVMLLAEPSKRITYVGKPDPGYPLVVLLAVANLPQALAALIERAPDQAHALDPYGNSALAWAARLTHVEVVRRLLAAGLDPLQKNAHRQSALSLLAMKRDASSAKTETARLLIARVPSDRFSSIGVVDMVWMAAYMEDFDMTRVLVEAGVPPHYVAPQGRTALYSAVEARNLEAVRFLLAHGARVSNTPYRGQTIFQLAEELRTRSPETQEIHRLIELERRKLVELGREPPGSSPRDWMPPPALQY